MNKKFLTLFFLTVLLVNGVLAYESAWYDASIDQTGFCLKSFIVEHKEIKRFARLIKIEKVYKPRLSTILNIKHYRNDELILDFWKDDDLILENFVNFTFMTLCGLENYCGFRDDQGQTGDFGRDQHDREAYLPLGTGTTAPTVDDYELENETHRETLDSWLITTSGTDFNITATAFYTFADSYPISETGLCSYINEASDEVFWTRDIFTPINVILNDTLAVSLILAFESGITDNYGEMLTTYWKGTASGYNYPEAYDDGSAIDIQALWDDDLPASCWWKVVIGNSTDVFQLTDRELGNVLYEDEIEVSAQTIWDQTGNDYNLTVIGYFTITGTHTIREVGILTPVQKDSVTDHVEELLICRETGLSDSVTIGDNVAYYVTWEIDQ